MRTIKFRGKRVDNGEWVYGDLIHDCNKNPMINIAGYSHTGAGFQYQIIVILETVGQFTGLFDKNGKEIYEGDIMVICNNTTVVKFSGNGFYQISICGEFSYCNFSTEVIGNIHDNPELLKTDSE